MATRIRTESSNATPFAPPAVTDRPLPPVDLGRDPLRPRRLAPGEIAPFLSPYLGGGYREDVARLAACWIGPGSIGGLLDVDSHFAAGDGFHLTVPLTMIWVAQLAIVYGCIDAGQAVKRGEAYLRAFDIECRKPVRKLEGIWLSLTLDARRRIPGHVLYKGRFAVEDDHFVGRASFILPAT